MKRVGSRDYDYWPPIGWKTTILVSDWSPVHPDLRVLVGLPLQGLVVVDTGPGPGQQDLHLSEEGSVAGGGQQLLAGLRHQQLDLVHRVLAAR